MESNGQPATGTGKKKFEGFRRASRSIRRAALLASLGIVLLAAPDGALVTTAPAAPAGTDGAEIVLLAVGDLRGELEPCGCSPEGQMGGLPRRLTYLAQRNSPADDRKILVDLGNNFPAPTAQGRLKIELIQALLRRTDPAAILPGPNEIAAGIALLDRKLPYLVSNDEVGRIFLPSRTVAAGKLRVGIFGFLSPGLVYQGSQEHFRLRPAEQEWFREVRREIAAKGFDRTLLLFRGSDEELTRIVAAGIFHTVVSGNPFKDELNQVVSRSAAGAAIPQVPTKGQGLLRFPLSLPNGQGAPKPAIDWLTEQYRDDPAAREAFKDYDEKVKALFFARMEMEMKRKAATRFAGAETCAACHAAQQKIWAASRHARALPTLEKVGKQFDPECLACHVVGLGAQGFLSAELTPNLAGVQCENCHGPAKAHLQTPAGVKPGPVLAAQGNERSQPGEATCRTCHVGSHSPTFEYGRYWPKIAH